MGRALLVLETPADKAKATMWIGKAPVGTRVEFKASKRTLPQNDLMWALLTEVAQQLDHAGRKYDPSQWKAIFLHAFGREVSFLPSLDQKTFLPIELSSADLSKDEMTDFIEFILKEGGERGVVFRQHNDNSNSASADPAPSGQSPDNDETAPVSSQEGGDDSQPPTGSSPPSQVPWLVTAARMLLAATHAGGDTDDHLNLLNNQRKAVPVPENATQEERDRAGSMYRQCKSVVLLEITMEKAKELVASYAGCDLSELEQRA